MISGIEHNDIDLDSQVKLIRFTYGLESWQELVVLCDQLYQSALQDYNIHDLLGDCGNNRDLERPLVYYIGISKLMQGLAFQKMFNYQESRNCILAYSNWNWVKETNESIDKEISNFIQLASLNKRVLDILEGDNSQVSSYIEHIKEDNRELTAGLLTLLEANRINKLNINFVDNMLENHAKEEVAETILEADKPSYLKYLYEYMLYKIRVTNSPDVINSLLKCLNISTKLDLNSTPLFRLVYIQWKWKYTLLLNAYN